MAKQKVIKSENAEEDHSEPELLKDDCENSSELVTQPLTAMFSPEAAQLTDDEIREIVNRQILFELTKVDFEKDYNILFLFDENSITRSSANRIYNAVTEADPKKPILLIMSSSGGDIAAAYFIAKLCREHTTSTFEVVVPRQAKSAATLICCGADRIHMGHLSELGPIDPQFDGVPALALKHSVDHLAQLVTTYPAAAEMFSTYLAKSIRVEALGYYERVAKSAVQYAVRLLESRNATVPEDVTALQIANRLVYDYTDHGFVIDAREAIDIFGKSVVACHTPQYKAANSLYQSLSVIGWLCSIYQKHFSYIGSAKNACFLLAKKNT